MANRFPLILNTSANQIQEIASGDQLNLSGNNIANAEERKDYYNYDCEHKERERIATDFNALFPKLQADVGGETGIDIFEKGRNKSQILSEFSNTDRIKFYGDRTDPKGNDYPLAKPLLPEQVYAVEDWQHTRSLLNEDISY